MVSPPSLQPGCFYHIYARGNNRENLFFEERNYEYFINLYVRHIPPVADTYSYCLMRNHLHLFVRIKDEEETLEVSKTFRVFDEASRAFGNLFNAYAKAINKAYNRTGSLFEHPFGRKAITENSHFTWLVAYIHQNPQKHGFVADFRQWPYSSLRALNSSDPTFLNRKDIHSWFGGHEGLLSLHQIAPENEKFAKLGISDFD